MMSPLMRAFMLAGVPRQMVLSTIIVCILTVGNYSD